jgi:Circadian oscillating protein COP23
MKFLRLSIPILVSVSITGTYITTATQAIAVETSFVCGTYENKPATIARTSRGDVPIVVWSSAEFSGSGFTPNVRCKQVSARFQSFYRSGQLKYITTGTINKLPALCATKQLGNTCNSQNLLYTLKPTSDPQKVIKKLMMLRSQASSPVVAESFTPAKTDQVDPNSIDLKWLEAK